MPIGAAVAYKAGIHQLQTVQQLRSCTEGAANAIDVLVGEKNVYATPQETAQLMEF